MTIRREIEAYAKQKLGIEIKIEKALSNNASRLYLASYEGDACVLKLGKPETVHPAKNDQTKEWESNLPSRKYRAPIETRNSRRSVKLETSVLKRWEHSGIEASRIIHTDGESAILLDYIPGRDYISLVREGMYRTEHDDALIATISKIREVARSEKDKGQLHNDLHPGNFMFDARKRTARAIDPGMSYKKDISFQEMDACLTLLFGYSLLPGYFFEPKHSETTRKTFQRFVESLDPETKKFMAEINGHASEEHLAHLLKIRDREEHRWINTFNKNNYEIIQEALRK